MLSDLNPIEGGRKPSCVFISIRGSLGLPMDEFDLQVPFEPDGETPDTDLLSQYIYDELRRCGFGVGNIRPNDIEIDEIQYE